MDIFFISLFRNLTFGVELVGRGGAAGVAAAPLPLCRAVPDFIRYVPCVKMLMLCLLLTSGCSIFYCTDLVIWCEAVHLAKQAFAVNLLADQGKQDVGLISTYIAFLSSYFNYFHYHNGCVTQAVPQFAGFELTIILLPNTTQS